MKFLEALRQAEKGNKNIVIPEIKIFSSKEGNLVKGRNVVDYVKELVSAGAPVLSVVTEGEEFRGAVATFQEIVQAVSVPILRKDIIRTKEDLLETVEMGASAILLKCDCLKQEELDSLYHQALEAGLDPFVEVNTEEALTLVKELGAELIGVNNSNIASVKSSIATSFAVSEDLIINPMDVRKSVAAGADAVLVGTAIAQAENPKTFYQMMCNKICLKVCGLMNEADIQMCVREGVERMGLVTEFPTPVPWNILCGRAKELRKFIPKGHQAVMVTGGSSERILELAEAVRPDLIQMHCKGTLEETRALVEELRKLGVGVVAKLPTREKDQLAQFGTTELPKIVEVIGEMNVEEILIDPRNPDNAAAKKLEADLELVKKVREFSKLPVILAGGITPENVAEKLRETGAVSVDVMNGSEIEPGQKSAKKVQTLVSEIRRL